MLALKENPISILYSPAMAQGSRLSLDSSDGLVHHSAETEAVATEERQRGLPALESEPILNRQGLGYDYN